MIYSTSHIMQLPRKVIIGENILNNTLDLIKEIILKNDKIILITGSNVKKKINNLIEDSFTKNGISYRWIIAGDASFQSVENITNDIKNENIEIIVGLGGGRCIDLGKMTANNLKKPFISIPTSASHDGISSPFVSLRGGSKPYSIKVETPIEIIADLDIIYNAPYNLIASGCGDLIAKITAIKDWELARDDINEYFGEYAANLSYLSAKMILDVSKNMEKYKKDGKELTRAIVEGLISAGVAAGIAGSSRPCSGSEHLLSHALEYIKNGKCGLHGERVGISTIIMARLHKLNWEDIKRALENLGAPTTAKEIKTDKEELIEAFYLAAKIRPERYTILNKIKLDKNQIENILQEVGVI
ncbi:MAG: sn-glycerol-1-phosphate dehydrogenase [Candidatus Nitrosocosmicus sp.]